MTHNAPSPTPPASYGRKPRGTIGHIQVVLTIAFLVATVFTARPPTGLLPDTLKQRITNAFVPNPPTALPGFPTGTPRPNLRIGIVSGHWGNDSGAVCQDGLSEAELNQDVATRVKESLIGQGLEVDLLKEFDPRLTDYRATVLVSIHADSCNYINDQATGYKVAAAMSTVYPENAARLTACLRQRYAEATSLPYHTGSVTLDMTSYHAFDEINPDTIAAIIETGFMNLDRQMLTEQPDVIAQGITNGILCYIRNEDLSTTNSPPSP